MQNPTTTRARRACLFGGALFHAGLAATAAAQPGFSSSVFEGFASNQYVTSIVPVDLNGDGALDFLVNQTFGSDGEVTLDWHESDGQSPPMYTKRPDIGTLFSVRGDVTTADLDGDGDQDIVVTGNGPLAPNAVFALSWDENDGQDPPSFTRNNIEVIGGESDYSDGGFSDVAAADINGDGHIDLAVTSVGSYTEPVVWFENNGAANPSFARRVVDASLALAAVGAGGPAETGSVRIADVTNDGHADLIVGADGAVVVYESDGAFPTPSFTKSIIANPTGGVEVHIVDLNHDTHLDILYGTRVGVFVSNAGELGYLANSGTTPPVWTDVPLAADGPFGTFESGDIDADGHTDFIATRARLNDLSQTNGTYWFDNDGGSFTRRAVFSESQMEARDDAALFDFDGDGDLDVLGAVSRTNNARQILFHENDLDPALPVITMQPASQFVALPGDGVFTIAAIGDGVLAYQWKLDGVPLLDGPGVVGANTTMLTITGSTNAAGVYTCEVSNPAGTTASAPAVLGVGPAPSSCAGDINGDGATDVFDFADFAADFGCETP